MSKVLIISNPKSGVNNFENSINYVINEFKNFNIDITLIKKRLSNYFGGNESNYEYVKNFSIKNATIMQNKNFFQSNSYSSSKSFIIAGGHSIHGSIEGAVLSGIKASEKVLN